MATLPVFIIDDGMELCRDLRGWLEHAGHVVECSPPSRLTLARLAGAPPALFLIGISAGGDDGLAFYRRLGSHRQLRHVPIIAVSDDPELEYELLDAYDFHLRPFDRQRLLASVGRLVEAAGKGRPPLLAHLETEQLLPFRQFLQSHSGLFFAANNQRLLERGLLHRMQALQITTPAKYLAFLTRPGDNQDELNKLLGLLTIGETCFFRYRVHRDVLVKQVLPELVAHGEGRRRLRIWSAGCSTGEEPYSLAMVLLEHFPQLAGWDVQILATDINKRSLRLAREGIYRQRALRQTDEQFRQRYFRQVGEHFVLDRSVRNMVRFGYLNLQGDPYPDPGNGTSELDLILCRNVLIYFQPETIRQIVDRFSECLRQDGYLFLGHAETLQGLSDNFQRQHHYGAFYYQRKRCDQPLDEPVRAPSPPAPPLLPSTPPVVRAVTPSPVSTAPALPVAAVPPPAATGPGPGSPRQAAQSAQPVRDSRLKAAMAAFDREDFLAAAVLFDQLLADYPEHPPALVGKGLVLANQGRYEEARQWCARAIRYDDLFPASYLLRGLILDMEEQLERALVEYHKVLWLDRDFVMAHYLSAKVYSRLGQPEKRVRSLRNTIRTLEKQMESYIVPYSGGLSRPVLLHLCRQEIAEVQGNG